MVFEDIVKTEVRVSVGNECGSTNASSTRRNQERSVLFKHGIGEYPFRESIGGQPVQKT